MCPSYRVTRDETHLTRGRANTLRLALTGQLGADAMASDAVADAMALCVSCKACRRECPTGVDMAKMKIEVLAARVDRNGVDRRDRLIAELPRYAPWLSPDSRRLPICATGCPRCAGLGERMARVVRRARPAGLAARCVPRQRGRRVHAVAPRGEVLLLADTFNR